VLVETKIGQDLNQRLAASGFRTTAQRELVYNLLLAQRDHPTAEKVFLRAKKAMPDISMATVYNCLETLVKAGLVREVIFDRGAMRYCPNMNDHFHFHCQVCGQIVDIDFESVKMGLQLPRGFQAGNYEILIHGTCPGCAGRKTTCKDLVYEHGNRNH
jgi:Fur family transcriptional regulator, peroxide stress response regulator